ncbi:MAG: hypothetical protein R3C05_31250 [Pirellulaceae bacterium]
MQSRAGMPRRAVDSSDDVEVQSQIKQLLDRLNERNDTAVIRRLYTLRMLLDMSMRCSEVSPPLAAELAGLALESKEPDEHQMLVDRIDVWNRWKYFRLALVDQLPSVRRTDENRELLERITDQAIDFNQADWMEGTRLTLLESVANDFDRPDNADGDLTDIDSFAEFLAEVYRVRGRLYGIALDPNLGSMPGKALQPLVSAYAERLKQQIDLTGSEPSAVWLRLASRAIEAIDFVSENDLSRTVLLQRIYWQLLSADLVNRNPEVLSMVDETLQKAQARDKESRSLLQQVRDGERTVVELISRVQEVRT